MLRLVPVESGAGAGAEQDGGDQSGPIDCLLKTQPFWQISCCSEDAGCHLAMLSQDGRADPGHAVRTGDQKAAQCQWQPG